MDIPRAARRWLSALIMSVSLAGCSAGRDFARPDTSPAIHISQTSPSEVLALYGPPTSRSDMRLQGRGLPVVQIRLAYQYSARSDFVDALARDSKEAVFEFQDGVLRSLAFISDFPSDQHDFSADLVERLVHKPNAMLTDFVTALGPPQSITTILPGWETKRLAWYTLVHGQRNGIRVSQAIYAKHLIVDFAADGSMTSHRFQAVNN